MHNKVPKNEYTGGKRPSSFRGNPYKKDRVVYDKKSELGYSDGSPYAALPYIDIYTPQGIIDMSNTGIPLTANGQYLPPYSGLHDLGTNVVREIPIPIFETKEDFYKDALRRKRDVYWDNDSSGSGVPFPTTNMPSRSTGVSMPSVNTGYQGIAMQYGGDPSIPDLTQAKKGGWLNKYSKMPKKKSSKNIKTSINKLMTRNPLFERNYMLYGAKGPRLYDPNSKYQGGGQPAAPMTYDEYADIYFQNLADLEAEKARVAQVRSNIIPTAQKIDAAANPQKFLVGAPATGNFCNAYTNQCYNIAGATTVAPIGNIPAGSRMPMIPGNLAQQAVLSQEGIVSIPLSEAQPGDIIKKEYYSPGLPWQGNYNPQGNPYWLPGHSMIYAGTDAQGNPMVYNSPGGRNIYESRTFKPSEWKENTRGTFTGNPTGTSRMQAYKYVGNTPALETEAQQSRQQMLGATSYITPKTAYLSSPTAPGVVTPNYQQLYDQRKEQFDKERKAIEDKRYLSKRKKKADLKALDQQEKDTLAMYIQPTPISTPPASIETNTASVTPNGSKKKYGGWLDSYQNRK